MNFFNTKDLSELTTNMMADCSSMESLLSSTIPPLIANGITVTLTCILLAFLTGACFVRIYHGSDCLPHYLAQPEPSKEAV